MSIHNEASPLTEIFSSLNKLIYLSNFNAGLIVSFVICLGTPNIPTHFTF